MMLPCKNYVWQVWQTGVCGGLRRGYPLTSLPSSHWKKRHAGDLWAKYSGVFTASALHLKMLFLHLKRICTATETKTLSPLKSLYFFSLHLMPHIETRYPAEESEPWKLRRVSALAESEHRL